MNSTITCCTFGENRSFSGLQGSTGSPLFYWITARYSHHVSIIPGYDHNEHAETNFGTLKSHNAPISGVKVDDAGKITSQNPNVQYFIPA